MRNLLNLDPEKAFRREAKAILPRGQGQTALAVVGIAALMALSACDAHKPSQGVIGYVAGFVGFVSAEEPRAALVGDGGNPDRHHARSCRMDGGASA